MTTLADRIADQMPAAHAEAESLGGVPVPHPYRRCVWREKYRGFHIEVTAGPQHEYAAYKWLATGCGSVIESGGPFTTMTPAVMAARAFVDGWTRTDREMQAAWALAQAAPFNAETEG